MKKLALEGTSFSGKTTLTEELEKHNSDCYKMIQEYVVYAGGSKNFPPYPPKNKEEALRNLNFFLDLERRRHADMEQYKNKPYVMVMDRSVISLLGFRFAQKYLSGLDIFCEAKEIIRQEPELAPDFIVYLHATDEQIKKRHQDTNRPVGDMFVDPEFNRQIRIFFDWLVAEGKYPIVTIETDKSLEQVKNELIIVADGLKDLDQSTSF